MSKFKNTEELEKAYKELEKEFTKKSQKLAEAQKTIEIQNKVNDALIDENLDYRYDITDTAYERAKEMAESWEEDYQQELHELKHKLALTKKALELACEQIWAMSIWENTKDEVIADNIKFFKDKAELILFYTEKPLATGGAIKQSTLDKIMRDINTKKEMKSE